MTLNRSSLPIEIQKLIIAFSSLPGIGPKTAQRLTFYVLSQNIEETMNEAMYTNQTFDSSGFQNDTNQRLSNMAPSPFTRHSSNYP